MVLQTNVIKTKKTSIWVDELGILHVKPIDGAEIDLEEVRACFQVYESLGCKENKMLQILDGRNSFVLTEEARSFVSSVGKNYFIASAALGNSLPIRLMVNFFNRFYKHDVPFKLFGTEEAAIEWLLKFRK